MDRTATLSALHGTVASIVPGPVCRDSLDLEAESGQEMGGRDARGPDLSEGSDNTCRIYPGVSVWGRLRGSKPTPPPGHRRVLREHRPTERGLVQPFHRTAQRTMSAIRSADAMSFIGHALMSASRAN